MFQQLRANPLASAALVVALTGTSLAVVGLPHNSVGSKQIKKGGVHRSDLGNASVSASKLAKGSVTKNALAAGALPAKGATGPQGPAGPTEGFSDIYLGGAIPSNTPEAVDATITITTATAGRIFGFGRGAYYETCSAGSPKMGLYVDGTIPLVGSGFPLVSAAPATEVNVWGISATSVPAGTHTLSLRTDCVGGNWTGSGAQGDGALGAIVLGG